jgi:hypothetical protein
MGHGFVPFPPTVRPAWGFFQQTFCHALFESPRFSLSGFIFSMFSASFLEKALFRSFVFNMFSASWFFATGGLDVAMQLGGVEAGKPAS